MNFNVCFRAILLFLFLVVCCNGADECQLGNLTDKPEVAPIEDVENTLIFTYTGLLGYGPATLTPCTGDFEEFSRKHIHISANDTDITLTTKDMTLFEEEYTSDGTGALLCVELRVACNPTFKKEIKVFITDTNNQRPHFIDGPYTVEIPMPLPGGMSLDNCNNPRIKAKDIDFMGEPLTFTIDSTDLDLQFYRVEDGSKNKIFSSFLSAKQTLNFPEKTYTITVSDGVQEDETQLIIKKLPELSVVHPKFQKSHYECTYKDGAFENMDIILEDGENADFKVISKNEYAKYFDVDGTGYPQIRLVAKESLYSILEDYVALSIEASVLNQDEPALTAVFVDIVHPAFEKSHYEGEYNSEDIFDMPTITLVNGNNAEVTTIPEASEDFEIDANDKANILITLKNPDDIDKDYINFDLVASHTGSSRVTSANVLIKIFKECIPETTTQTDPTETTTQTDQAETTTQTDQTETTTQTDQTETTTKTDQTGSTDSTLPTEITPTTETPHKITFITSPKLIEMNSGDLLNEQYVATSTMVGEKINYQLSGDVPASLVIGIENGILKSTAPIPSKIYRLVIKATGSKSGASADVVTILNVFNVEVCDNGDLHVPFSMQIINVMEGASQTILPVNPALPDYVYKLIDEVPQVPQESMFEVMPDGSVACKELDREAAYFEGVAVPQFTITVELQKKSLQRNSSRIVRRSPSLLIGDELLDDDVASGISMYTQIPFNPMRTVIGVIIDDENDNFPEFTETHVVVCYPSKKLLSRIRPTHLIRVEATDLDSIENGNGKIKYTTSSEAVVIDEDTGMVYATENIYDDDEFTFKIQAEDGGGNQAITDMTVEVKIIAEDQIAEIELINTPFHKLDEKLKELSTSTGITIKSFSITPIFPTRKRSLRDSEDYSFHVYIYGMKSNIPVTTENLKEKLEEVGDVEVKPVVPDSNEIDDDTAYDTTGLIAAVSVLAVLLVILLLSITAFWFFKLRIQNSASTIETDEETGSVVSDDKPNGRLFKPNSNVSKISASPKPRVTQYVNNPARVDDDDDDGLETDTHKNDSYKIFGTTIADSIDSDVNPSIPARVDPASSPKVKRRPTGYIRYPPPIEEDEDDDESQQTTADDYTIVESQVADSTNKSAMLENKPSNLNSNRQEVAPAEIPEVDYKSVQFSSTVVKIEIEAKKNDDDDDSDSSDGDDVSKKSDTET